MHVSSTSGRRDLPDSSSIPSRARIRRGARGFGDSAGSGSSGAPSSARPSARADRRRRRLVAAALAGSLLIGSTIVPVAEAQIARSCTIDPDDPEAPLPVACASFAFDIQLTAVTDPTGLFGSVLPGDVQSGTFTTFTAFPDLDGTSEGGRYLNAVECMTLDLGTRRMTVDLEPVEVSLPVSPSDPGVRLANDEEQSGPGFSLFVDSVTYLIAGPATIDLVPPADPADRIEGGGGFSFGLGDTCFTPGQTPCPPLLLIDDGFPQAAGDTTGLESALMTFDFLGFQNQLGTADA